MGRGENPTGDKKVTTSYGMSHCRFFPEHLQRLLDGCERLRIPPPDQAVLESEAAGLAEDCDHGALKIIVTRGAGPRAGL